MHMIMDITSICGVGSQRGATCSPKNGPFFRPLMLRMKNVFVIALLTVYMFEKLMILTLERGKTDFDLCNLFLGACSLSL